jgi:hypothetical protein
LFLPPPDDFSFACETKRPSVVGYKAIVHEPAFFREWYARFRKFYGVSADTLNNRDALQLAKVQYGNCAWDLSPTVDSSLPRPDFLLVNLAESPCSEKFGKLIRREGNWAVIEIYPTAKN